MEQTVSEFASRNGLRRQYSPRGGILQYIEFHRPVGHYIYKGENIWDLILTR